MSSIITQPPSRLSWQQELARSFSDPVHLLDHLGLERKLCDHRATACFAFRVPRPFAARMRRGDPQDPLLLQVLPLGEENTEAPGFSSDPVGDRQAQAAPGLIHKYHGRALLITTGACAVHCRYCFRREYPYHDNQLTGRRLQAVLMYLHNEPSIQEIILSGGDPLVMSNAKLDTLIAALADIPHLRRLRVHSRLPVVLPTRVDGGLIEALTSSRLQTLMVVHINHANEIDDDVRVAIDMLKRAGLLVLNQSTLLAGINDDLDTLTELQEQLFEAGILPYYLHLLDRAHGTAHFEVPESSAKALHEGLRRRLPGYLVPRLARDHPHSPYKILL